MIDAIDLDMHYGECLEALRNGLGGIGGVHWRNDHHVRRDHSAPTHEIAARDRCLVLRHLARHLANPSCLAINAISTRWREGRLDHGIGDTRSSLKDLRERGKRRSGTRGLLVDHTLAEKPPSRAAKLLQELF